MLDFEPIGKEFEKNSHRTDQEKVEKGQDRAGKHLPEPLHENDNRLPGSSHAFYLKEKPKGGPT